MNYGKYTVGIHLMLLKQFLEANAGKDCYVTRGEIEKYLTKQGFPVEENPHRAAKASAQLMCGAKALWGYV